MKKLLVISFAIVMSCCAYASAPTPNNGDTLAPLLQKAMPAVVNIAVRGQMKGVQVQLGGNQPNISVKPKFAAVGSGVIVDANKGYIVTNAHVVKDAKIIIVTLNDKRRVQGKLIGADTKSDIAIVKINAKHLTAIPLGNSTKLKVGDYVTAIGNPFGLGQTVTSGVISGLNRSGLGIEGYENFIQTDAPINPGNSGGALLDMHGDLIGMNTAIISPYASGGGSVGIGFAIPVNMIKEVMSQIVKYGKVEHSLLGVIVQNISPALAEAFKFTGTEGALVAQVNPGSPADIAGLQQKDVIIKINNDKIRNATQVSNTIGLMRPKSKVSITILRAGKTLVLHAVTESMKKAKEEADKAPKSILSGLALENFSQLTNNQQTDGVRIMGVDDFSVAYSYGLRPGDVIVEAANQPVASIKELKRIAAQHPDKLLLRVQRGPGAGIYVVLER